jgi:hypothetical protein
MYFAFLYENIAMKFVEIIVRSWREEMRENDGGAGSN